MENTSYKTLNFINVDNTKCPQKKKTNKSNGEVRTTLNKHKMVSQHHNNVDSMYYMIIFRLNTSNTVIS